MSKKFLSFLLVFCMIFQLTVSGKENTSGTIIMDVSEYVSSNIEETSKYEDGYGMYAGKFAEYIVKPAESGMYDITLDYGAFDSVIEIFIDDVKVTSKNVNTGGWNTRKEEVFANIRLHKGFSHRLKIRLADNAKDTVILKKIIISKTGDVIQNENEIIKFVTEYTQTNIPGNRRYGDIDSKFGYELIGGEYIQFDVNVIKNARFSLNLQIASIGQVISVICDDKIILEKEVVSDNFDDLKEIVFGDLNLRKGLHKIKVFLNPDAKNSCQLRQLILKKSGEYEINKQIYTLYADETSSTNIPENQKYGNGRNGPGYGFSNTQYIEFTPAVIEGIYEISFEIASIEDTPSLFVDSMKIGNTTVKTGKFDVFDNIVFGKVNLTEGKHTFKILLDEHSKTGACHLKKLTLKRTGDYEEPLVIKKEAEDFVALFDTTPGNSAQSGLNSDEVSKTEGFMLLDKNEWNVYNIDITESGIYSLKVRQLFKGDESIKLIIDGKTSEYGFQSPESNEYDLYGFGAFPFSVGKHEIKFEITNGKNIKIDYFDFTKISDIKVETKNIVPRLYSKMTGSVTELDNSVFLRENSSVSYDIYNCAYSVYALKITSEETNRATIQVLCDNVSMSALDLTGDGKTTVSYFRMDEGLHNITVRTLTSSAEISALEIICLPELNESKMELIRTGIENAKNSVEIEDIIKNYLPVCGEDTVHNPEEIFYEAPVFGALTGKIFKSFDDLMNCYYSAFQSEIENPSVSLWNENRKINKIETGNLSVKIKNTHLNRNTVVIAAVYKDNSLYRINTADITGPADVSISLGNVEVNSQNEYSFRLFFWENIKFLKPKNAYDKVYMQIYVSPDGNDTTGDGSYENPFNSIKKVKSIISENNETMRGNIEVVLMGGEYFLTETEIIDETCSGKNGYDVIFKTSDKNNPPVISGGTKILNWTKNDDKIWSADVNQEYVRDLYCDGESAHFARSNFFYEAEELVTQNQGSQTYEAIKIMKSHFPEIANPSGMELVWDLEWTCQRIPVERIEDMGDHWNIYPIQNVYDKAINKDYPITSPTPKKPFYIENVKECLDKEGEFCYSKEEHKIYFYPFDNKNPNDCEMYISSTEGLLNIGGSIDNPVSNICFDGITFMYGGSSYASENGFVTFQADKLFQEGDTVGRGGKILPSQITINNSSDITIKNCTFRNMGSGAVSMMSGVKNADICGNIFYDLSGTGIIVGHWDHSKKINEKNLCRNIDITNNVLWKNSTQYRGGTAISIYYAEQINVLHNDIKAVPYSAITAGWGWGEDIYRNGKWNISYNKIEDVMYALNDGAHIYTLGDMKNSVISNNYLLNSHNDYFGGIYNDSGSSDVEIYKNVIENSYLWYMQGLYNTKNINAYENYSTSVNTYRTDKETSKIDDPIVFQSLKQKGYENIIKNNAGLLKNFSHLTDNIQVSDKWLTTFEMPSKRYVSGIVIEAEDFMKGGEGVGYHKLRPGNPDGIYRKDKVDIYKYIYGGYVVGNTCGGEWLKYEMDVKQSGMYKFFIRATTVSNGKKINVYVDDKLVAQNIEIPAEQSWNDMSTVQMAACNMSEGKHTFIVEFVNGDLSLDYFNVIRTA